MIKFLRFIHLEGLSFIFLYQFLAEVKFLVIQLLLVNFCVKDGLIVEYSVDLLMSWSWRMLLREIYHWWVVALSWICQQNVPLRSIYFIVSKLNRWLCLLLLNHKLLLVFAIFLVRWHDLRRHKVVVDEVIIFFFVLIFGLRLIFTIWLIEVFDDIHALQIIETRYCFYDHGGPSYDTILSRALLVSCLLSQWNL